MNSMVKRTVRPSIDGYQEVIESQGSKAPKNDLLDYTRQMASGAIIICFGIVMIMGALAMMNYAIYALFGTVGLNVFVVTEIILLVCSLVYLAMMNMMAKVSNVVLQAHTAAVNGIVKHQANDDAGEMARWAAMSRVMPTMIRAGSDADHDEHARALKIVSTARALGATQTERNDQDFFDMMQKSFAGRKVEEVE